MTIEECTKCYWQGYDAFDGLTFTPCPYKYQSQARAQWLAGYNDAKVVNSGIQDYKEYEHDYNKDYNK